MALFPSTDLPKLKDNEDDLSVRKAVLDLLDKINSSYDSLTARITSLQNTKMIYDSGSNANGNWIKWADGTMQCWGLFPGSTSDPIWTFPQAFISTPSFWGNCQSGAGGSPTVLLAIYSTSVSTTSVQTRTRSQNGAVTAALGGDFSFFAIGKWK